MSTGMHEARALAASVKAAGGTMPTVLTNLINGIAVVQSLPPIENPMNTIADTAEGGGLTQDKLLKLLGPSAQASKVADYQASLLHGAQKEFAARFFARLRDGAADEIIDGLRPGFHAATEKLAQVTATVDVAAATPEWLAERATPEQTAAWRSLRPIVTRLDAIAAAVKTFGLKGDFPVIVVPGTLDLRGLRDEALLCTDGVWSQASQVFAGRMADVRTSPWLRISPRLLTITEAQERLRAMAEVEWDQLNQGRGRVTTDGGVVPDPIPNPHALPEPADA